MRTPSGPPVSTAIAPIQVGACWRPTGSSRPLVDEQRLRAVPSSSSSTPARLLALLGDARRPARRRAGCATAAHSLQLGVVEVVEEVDGAQVGGGDVRAHASTRYWWMSETAIEPSPTALATRLIERARTSPATNTPGTLVSSR